MKEWLLILWAVNGYGDSVTRVLPTVEACNAKAVAIIRLNNDKALMSWQTRPVMDYRCVAVDAVK